MASLMTGLVHWVHLQTNLYRGRVKQNSYTQHHESPKTLGFEHHNVSSNHLAIIRVSIDLCLLLVVSNCLHFVHVGL